MKSQFIKTADELTTSTPQSLIDTRKYIGGWLFYNQTRRIFNAVVDRMEQLNYKCSTIAAMDTARNATIKRIMALKAPKKAKIAYIKDINAAAKGAILDELR